MSQAQDYRGVNEKGERITYLETLQAACRYYGTFCGRWHSNEYWADLLKRSETMSEEEAEAAVRQFEKEADDEHWHWQLYN